MQTALDIIGSLFLFGIFLMSMNNLNLVIMDSVTEANVSSISRSDRNSFAEVLDYDFLKIGYRKGGIKIDTMWCTATSVGWYADANRDGSMDTIRYYRSSDDSTLLQREVNGNALTIRRGVTTFQVTYEDSTGAAIQPSSLPARALDLRGVGIYVAFSNEALPVDGRSNETYIRRKYFSKSLRP